MSRVMVEMPPNQVWCLPSLGRVFLLLIIAPLWTGEPLDQEGWPGELEPGVFQPLWRTMECPSPWMVDHGVSVPDPWRRIFPDVPAWMKDLP